MCFVHQRDLLAKNKSLPSTVNGCQAGASNDHPHIFKSNKMRVATPLIQKVNGPEPTFHSSVCRMYRPCPQQAFLNEHALCARRV